MPILISDEINTRARKMTRNKEGYYILRKGSVCQQEENFTPGDALGKPAESTLEPGSLSVKPAPSQRMNRPSGVTQGNIKSLPSLPGSQLD